MQETSGTRNVFDWILKRLEKSGCFYSAGQKVDRDGRVIREYEGVNSYRTHSKKRKRKTWGMTKWQ